MKRWELHKDSPIMLNPPMSTAVEQVPDAEMAKCSSWLDAFAARASHSVSIPSTSLEASYTFLRKFITYFYASVAKNTIQNDAHVVDDLLQRVNSTELEAQLMSLDLLVSLFGKTFLTRNNLPTNTARPLHPKGTFNPKIGSPPLSPTTTPEVADKAQPGRTETTRDFNNLVPLTAQRKGGVEEAVSEIRTDSLAVGESCLATSPHGQNIFRSCDDAPTLLHRPLELWNDNKSSHLLQAVKKLLDSRAIERVVDTSSPGYYRRLFLVPKPHGSFRPIIDLQKLNLYLQILSFKMETLFSIIATLHPQEWITKIDLKDAYHHILVHVNIQKYFRFVTAGKTYQVQVLLFGLSAAPREFTKTLAPLVQLLRTRGIRIHLDDWIIHADSPEQSVLHMQQTIQLLQTLGWTINWRKSILEPTHILDFLSLHLNLEQAIVSPPDSFLDSLTSALSHLSASMVMPACKITSINNRISHYAPFIHHGRLQLRFLQFWI